MKIRNDYVSNSSSSSYIVIANSGAVDNTEAIKSLFSYYNKEWCPYMIPNKEHKNQFGWEFEQTSSFGGKLNFVGIQLLYLFIEKMSKEDRSYPRAYTGKDFDRLYDMLKKVCKEKFDFNVKLNPDVIRTAIHHNDQDGYHGWTSLNDDFYIDHQSSASEGSCMEMFASEEALYDFLRFEESYIQGGNDNEEG